MLLSRRIIVQPTGAVIVAPADRRTVTAAIIISPPTVGGLGIVSDVDRDGDRPELLIPRGTSPIPDSNTTGLALASRSPAPASM